MKNRLKFAAAMLFLTSHSIFPDGLNTMTKDSIVAEYNLMVKDEKSLKIIKNVGRGDFHIENFSYAEREKVRAIAEYFNNMPEEWLYQVFYIECRGNHQVVNKTSGASGLIQFMPRTAERLGSSVEDIRKMSVLDQLDLVKLYLERINPSKKFDCFTDLYLAVFFPLAIDKPDSYVFGRSEEESSNIAKQNKAVDINNDSIITKEEFECFAEAKC